MKRYSLNRRLMLSLAASLALFFLVQTWMIGREVAVLGEANILSRLEHDQEEILAALDWPDKGPPRLKSSRLPAIYRHPFSGHYFELRADGHVLRSRSLWDTRLPAMQGEVVRGVAGPAEQRLLMLRRTFDWHGRPIELRVAEDVSASERSAAAFQRHLLLFASAAILALLVLQGWIVQYGLRPLLRVRDQLRLLERGEIDRVDAQGLPAEVVPLAEEVNRLVALIRRRLTRSRNALGDLAHALKTPLAAVGQLLESGSEASLAQARDRLRDMEHRITHELARARTAGYSPGGVWAHPARDVKDIVHVIGRAHPEIEVALTIDCPEMLAADREDMLEICGNLLDNAGKWARSRVVCRILAGDERLVIEVEDDGPGIAPDLAERMLRRGERADETRPGHGLGLAIVSDIVAAYEGRIALRSSESGGLLARVEIPLP